MLLVIFIVFLISSDSVISKKFVSIPNILRQLNAQDLKSEWECSYPEYNGYKCCGRVEIKDISVNSLACFNTTSLSDDDKAKFTFEMDKMTYWETTISESNPPPFCFVMPTTKDMLKACFRFRNLTWKDSRYSGCAYLTTYIVGIKIITSKLGCYNITQKRMFDESHYVDDDEDELLDHHHVQQAVKIKDSTEKPLDLKTMPTWRCVYSDYYSYDCCANFVINDLLINSKACFNTTSFQNDTAKFTFDMDNKVLGEYVISSKNTPVYCNNMPYSAYFTQLCVTFRNVSWKDNLFSACTNLTTHVMGVEVATFNFGCFNTNKDRSRNTTLADSSSRMNRTKAHLMSNEANIISTGKIADRYVKKNSSEHVAGKQI